MHSDASADKISAFEKRRRSEMARVKGLLIIAELKLQDVDKKFKLPLHTASNAIHEPHLAGERAIAAALKTHPHLLWPTRYHGDGRRKSPQPAENYRCRNLPQISREAA